MNKPPTNHPVSTIEVAPDEAGFLLALLIESGVDYSRLKDQLREAVRGEFRPSLYIMSEHSAERKLA